ncbi:C-type lectin mannose-binding isoform-like [Tachypleus tridentatus]|uniref:C-type lectin mannose-binding isoform-like n=1 Tax=Tachypleus tridentatus TaxID=6853 RepID=UPI003FD54667
MCSTNRCFTLFDKSGTWEYAKAYCKSIGQELATPSDLFTANLLIDLCKTYIRNQGQNTPSVWIGLSDVATEGLMVFNDETELDLNVRWPWTPGEPKNSIEYNCVRMQGSKKFLWQLFYCSNIYLVICERSIPDVAVWRSFPFMQIWG